MGCNENMPSKIEVIQYWIDNHSKHPEAKPWMGRVGEFFNERLCKGESDICFACDLIDGDAHIGHIKTGGGNECSNLHVLCDSCFSESRGLRGRSYWSWIANKCPAEKIEALQLASMAARLGSMAAAAAYSKGVVNDG